MIHWKSSLYISIYLVLLLYFTGCNKELPDHDNMMGTPSLTKNADDLTSTIIASHPYIPIKKNQNIVWCSTINIAWNMLCDAFVIKPSDIPGGLDLYNYMNSTNIYESDLFEDSYVAIAGRFENGIHAEIKKSLDDKFHGAASPELLNNYLYEDILSYCYMFISMEFKKSFRILDVPLDFRGESIKCFGDEDSVENHIIMYKYPFLGSWEDENEEIVIEIETKNKKEQFILARIIPESTLIATIEKVLKIVNYNQPATGFRGKLMIPMMNYNTIKYYPELSLKDIGGITLQSIRFILNEKGAHLKSEAIISGGKGDEIIFDKPFLLMMKKRKAEPPFFVMWVDNSELMEPFSNPGDN